jgi:hypothetical protein
MQRSLGNFAGFQIQKKTSFFNPFENEPLAADSNATVKVKKPVEITNILDAPPSSTITALPERKQEPVVNLFPTGQRQKMEVDFYINILVVPELV